MSFIRLIDWLETDHPHIRKTLFSSLVVLTICVYILVYYTGGVKYVYAHMMYVPIVLGALLFGVRGGILFAILGGVTLGPFMPINVNTGEMQETLNWVSRTVFFAVTGGIAGIASDSVRSYIKEIKWSATHDEPTGLPNRNALIKDITNHTVESASTEAKNLLLVASINNIRHLKMAYGIDVIDAAIEQISNRYEQEINELGYKSKIYRVDASSISALIPGLLASKVDNLLNDLVNVTKKPFKISQIPIHVDFRMGFVPFEKVDKSPQDYLHHAETAMNQAHQKLVDYQSYSEEIDKIARDNMSLLGELVDAIKAKQLELHYQPKIDTKTRKVVSVEALMRWHHPEHGAISPGIFIPCAEQSTLIHDITRFALEQAMAQIVRWQKIGINLPIAVNISPLNMNGPGLSDIVINLLNHYKLRGDQLELEVTEGALIMDFETSKRELTLIAEQGVKISIDDFGTGYSSLQYLDQLPIHAIKIDQSFIKRIFHNDSSSHIIEASISLAHRLHMKVIAEGVEDENAYAYLQDQGCDEIQGYYISRPQSERNFETWLKKYEQ